MQKKIISAQSTYFALLITIVALVGSAMIVNSVAYDRIVSFAAIVLYLISSWQRRLWAKSVKEQLRGRHNASVATSTIVFCAGMLTFALGAFLLVSMLWGKTPIPFSWARALMGGALLAVGEAFFSLNVLLSRRGFEGR